jgi:hypothetical protein
MMKYPKTDVITSGCLPTATQEQGTSEPTSSANEDAEKSSSFKKMMQEMKDYAQSLIGKDPFMHDFLLVVEVSESKDTTIARLTAEVERLMQENGEANGALWRIFPGSHCVTNPDPFDESGETYRDAYERLKSQVESLTRERDEARKKVADLEEYIAHHYAKQILGAE